MPSVTIWALESDHDAKAVECLANKLVTHLQLGDMSIRAVGRKGIPRRPRHTSPSDTLKRAVQNYLKEDVCVIFVIDRDGPMSTHQRKQEPNSLINQIRRVVNESHLAGKVFLAESIYELEAWLLIDCLGIFCYFASKRRQYQENSRDKVSTNQSFTRLVNRYQKGDTENIVEAVPGGKGPKEYLVEFSEQVLLALNPNMPLKNLKAQRYRENVSPDVAKHVIINQGTLQRNNSLCNLGNLLARFKEANGIVC